MQSWTPYRDTEVFFDGPQPLSRSNILDASAREIIGSASGYYQARTVRPLMQYFDCDLRFTEPLRIHKVLPESLCIVQVLEGGWSHSIDRRTPNRYTSEAPVSLGLSEPMEAVDILPAGSHARLAGLRIAGSFIHEQAEEGDTALLPLLRLQQDGVRFTPLPRCMALRSLFERLYQTLPRRTGQAASGKRDPSSTGGTGSAPGRPANPPPGPDPCPARSGTRSPATARR